ncbi:hypothetical protein HQ563_18810 [bacterium]|nr:hypothetical protein [bacterium]
MHCSRRYARLCCPLVLLAWMAWWGTLPADEYVERISSFETDAEAFMFTYDAADKGWARVSDKHAIHDP